MTDTASSLRQAALNSIKRKGAAHAPPTHPMAMARGAPSIQLDYGAGDDEVAQPAPEPEPVPER